LASGGFKKQGEDLLMLSNLQTDMKNADIGHTEVAIRISNLSKVYQIYDRPVDRLKELILPRLRRLIGLKSKLYHNEFWALKDISFEVKKGETIGIIGRNGAGKSTLLQAICGTLSPSSGDVEVNGRVAALLELGSGFNPEFTGRENVYMNASILGLTKEEIEFKYDRIVSFADIGEYIDQPVRSYSSGMLVRLAFAVIVHVDADILVIDEALAVGDVFFTQKCMRFLHGFMIKGTLLFVSHDTSSVQSLCDSSIWLDKGMVIAYGPTKDITERYLENKAGSNKKTSSDFLTKNKPKQELPKFDQRYQYINKSNLRNDLKLYEFDPNAKSFGASDAKITRVGLCNTEGSELSWCVGSEDVSLNIGIKVLKQFDSLIIGFFVKNSLGLTLFGDNTYLTSIENPIYAERGDYFDVEFEFQMPILPCGDYSISTAVASGSQDDHLQQHWIHDAITFKSISSSVSTGLVGIPMSKIKINKNA
jgi:lipopolysaccharide transport system ATP-binding protein